MDYQDVFLQFWEQVEESVKEKRFAKLTLAKTIGKPNLKNIFLRPIYNDNGFTVLLKLRYRERDTEDLETQYTLEESLTILKPYLKKYFLTVILFTTTKDVTFKINRKGAGSIVEGDPTFTDIIQAQPD